MDISYKTIILLTILIAHALTSIAAKESAQQSQSQVYPKNAERVLLNVTVTNKAGGFVVGLKPSDFEISIDKKPAHIISLSNADSPVSVGILFDSSGSMAGRSEKTATKNFAVLRQALRQFLELSNQSNDYFLLGFNIKPQLLVDWTSDRLTIVDKFNDLHLYGNTALYDACYLAVDKLQSGRHAKRALVLISDGQDNISQYSFNELRELLRETDVLLYSIHFPDDADLGSSFGIEGLGVLDELSSLSGGRAFFTKGVTPLRLKHANTVFENIATELRNQYTISIVPNDSIVNNKWHKIKVKVNMPPGAPRQMKDLAVRTREGFYAH